MQYRMNVFFTTFHWPVNELTGAGWRCSWHISISYFANHLTKQAEHTNKHEKIIIMQTPNTHHTQWANECALLI